MGIIGLATATVLTLAGCTGTANQDAPAGSAPIQETLRVVQGAGPNSFQIGYNNGGQNTIQLSVYDTVIHQLANGDLAPGIATKWDYNEARTQLTLQIRSGLKFTNGETLDAAAVAKSLEATHTGPGTSSDMLYIQSIEAPSASTVVINLSEPNAALVPLLATIDGAIAAPSTIGNTQSATDPIGSGPYKLDKSGTQLGSTYSLTKNDEFWDSQNYPYKKIVYSVMDPTAAFNGLQSGQLDFATVAPDQEKQLPSSQFVTGTDKATTYASIWIADRNGSIVPALANVKVRQAINMVFDRDSLSKLQPGVIHGTNQSYNPNGGAYLKPLASQYSFDVSKARQLMKEAGFADGFSVKMPATQVITGQYQDVITQSLGEIGIKVNWDNVTLTDMINKMISKNYPMYFFPNVFSSSEAQDTQNILKPAFDPFATQTPELKKLVADANASGRPEAFQKVNQYFLDNAWNVPLFVQTFHFAHTKSIGYTPATLYRDMMPPSIFTAPKS